MSAFAAQDAPVAPGTPAPPGAPDGPAASAVPDREGRARICAFPVKIGPFRLASFEAPALFLDLVGRAPAADLGGLLDRAGVDALRLAGCAVPPGARRLAFAPGAVRLVVDRETRRYAARAPGASFQDYLAGLRGKVRTEAGRRLRRFEAANGGPNVLRTFRAPDEALEFHRLARAISDASYQERILGVGIAPADELARAAAEDRFRGWLLVLKGTPVAYSYALAMGDVLVGARMGYAPAFAALSPGTVLMRLLLESFWTDRFARLDFGAGAFAYKADWATGGYPAAEIVCLRPSVRGVALVLALAASSALRDWGRAALSAWGIVGRRRRRLDALLRGRSADS